MTKPNGWTGEGTRKQSARRYTAADYSDASSGLRNDRITPGSAWRNNVAKLLEQASRTESSVEYVADRLREIVELSDANSVVGDNARAALLKLTLAVKP